MKMNKVSKNWRPFEGPLQYSLSVLKIEQFQALEKKKKKRKADLKFERYSPPHHEFIYSFSDVDHDGRSGEQRYNM